MQTAWWQENVFLRLLIAFAAGIWLSEYVPFDIWPAFVLPPVVLMIMAAYQGRDYKLLLRLRRWREAFIQLTLLSIGVLASIWLDPCRHPKHYCHHTDAQQYVARVVEPPEEKSKVVRVKAELTKALNGERSQETFGLVYMYLRKSERALSLQYGDMLVANNTLQPTQPDPNPHAIDYRFILRNKNIFRTGFLNDSQWTLLPEKQPNKFYAFALRMRDNVLSTLRSSIPDKDVYALAASLLIGYREEIDFQVENAYAAAGVVHIMAVSGMHVGLIFMLFNGLLKMLSFVPEWLRKVLLLSIIWFFSVISGLGGSVVRASMMLSIYIIGVDLKRYVSPHNILFASAFVLLAFRPRLLFDVGFELSFFAVAGILTFQKPLYNLIHVHNPILDWLVKMMSISAAAQLGTLPLILYYFHSFPVHFLLANLVVVPLATLIIYAMLLLLSLSFWDSAALFIGKMVTYGIEAMNAIVFTVRDLPFSVYRIYHFPFWMAVALGLVVWLVYKFIETRKRQPLNYALAICSVICAYSVAMYIYDGQRTSVVQFKHNRQPVVSIRNGREAVLVSPRNADFRVGAFDRYLEQYFQREGVKHVKHVYHDDSLATQKPFDWVTLHKNVFTLPHGNLVVTRDATVWFDANKNLVTFKQTQAPYRFPL